MNYNLSESHIKLLKILITIWSVIITILTLSVSFVFICKGGYNHPFLLFAYILAITSYINTYRFYRMMHDHNRQINSLQLKVLGYAIRPRYICSMFVFVFLCKKYFGNYLLPISLSCNVLL